MHHRLLPLAHLLPFVAFGMQHQQTGHAAHVAQATPSEGGTEQQPGLFSYFEQFFALHSLYDGIQLNGYGLLHDTVFHICFADFHILLSFCFTNAKIQKNRDGRKCAKR